MSQRGSGQDLWTRPESSVPLLLVAQRAKPTCSSCPRLLYRRALHTSVPALRSNFLSCIVRKRCKQSRNAGVAHTQLGLKQDICPILPYTLLVMSRKDTSTGSRTLSLLPEAAPPGSPYPSSPISSTHSQSFHDCACAKGGNHEA